MFQRYVKCNQGHLRDSVHGGHWTWPVQGKWIVQLIHCLILELLSCWVVSDHPTNVELAKSVCICHKCVCSEKDTIDMLEDVSNLTKANVTQWMNEWSSTLLPLRLISTVRYVYKICVLCLQSEICFEDVIRKAGHLTWSSTRRLDVSWGLEFLWSHHSIKHNAYCKWVFEYVSRDRTFGITNLTQSHHQVLQVWECACQLPVHWQQFESILRCFGLICRIAEICAQKLWYLLILDDCLVHCL